jgi:hypothetical protein
MLVNIDNIPIIKFPFGDRNYLLLTIPFSKHSVQITSKIMLNRWIIFLWSNKSMHKHNIYKIIYYFYKMIYKN